MSTFSRIWYLWFALAFLAGGSVSSAQTPSAAMPLPEGIEPTGDTLEVRAALVWAEEYRQRHPEQAEQVAQHALVLAQDLDYYQGIGQSLSMLGHISTNFDQQEAYYEAALDIFEQIGNERWAALVRVFLGQAYSNQGRPEHALALYFDALEDFNRLHDTEGQIIALGSIGNTHREQKNIEESLTYQQRAVALAETSGNPGQLLIVLANLGATLTNHGAYEQAEIQYLRALALAEEHDYRRFTAFISSNLGSLFNIQGHYERALPHLFTAEQLAKETGEHGLLIAVYNGLGNAYLQLDDHDQALYYSTESLTLAQEIGLYQMEVHSTLSLIYEATGDHARALDHYRQYTVVKDSVFNAERTGIIAEMQTRYETEENRRAVERLEQENQIRMLQASRRQTLMLAGLGGLVFLLGFLFSRFRLKQKANRLLESQKEEIREKAHLLQEKHSELQGILKEKELLVKEIHHRVKNNLQVISSLLDLQVGILEEPRALSALKDAQGRVQSMVLVHRKLYREEHFGRIDVQDYAEDLCRYLLSAFNAKKVHYRVRAEGIRFDVDTAIPFGLILAELVSNALKHAFPNGYEGEIAVTLHSIEGNTYELQVADNGVGFSAGSRQNERDSIGLTLVEDLTQQLNGTLEIRNGQGVTYKIQFEDRSSIP